MLVSIFNDVIGPVMRGPSSSHCAAALRIGRLARDLLAGAVSDVLVEFDRQGSLPTTHASQGSDMGLCGGLLDWDAADERLPQAVEALRQAGIALRFATIDCGDPHPNTYRLTLRGADETHTLVAISTGGGMVEVIAIDGMAVSLHGDCCETLVRLDGDADPLLARLRAAEGVDDARVHVAPDGCLVEVKAQQFVPAELLADLAPRWVRYLRPVLPVPTRRDTCVPFGTCTELLRHDAGRGLPLWQHAVAYEQARGAGTAAQVLARMLDLVRLLRRSVAQGLAGTEYADRILGCQSTGFAQALAAGRLLPGGALNRAILYVTALMEVKSSLGVIVAAPTAGACAVLPGAVIAVAEERSQSEEAMAQAMLAAGLVGVFIATQWTFAAEAGGCQAEGGSAASMAAAALVTLAGGTLAQALGAAAMALQNMLGLICDPVANRVEVPCLGKNVMAASNALACANMALAGYDPVIGLDEVIAAARRVSAQMPRELRCTALGGLAITPTSLALEQRLAQSAGGCGCGAGGACANQVEEPDHVAS